MNVNQLAHECGWSVDSLIRPASSGTGNARNVDAMKEEDGAWRQSEPKGSTIRINSHHFRKNFSFDSVTFLFFLAIFYSFFFI